MCHQTTFDRKRNISSEDIAEAVPLYNLDLEDSNPNLSQDTLIHDDA